MSPATRRAVETALGVSVSRAVPVSGGDINEACRAVLSDGRIVFVKTNDRADPRMFPAEARGLAWLAGAGALRVPEVVAVSKEDAGARFLVLEHLEPAPRADGFDERLGRGLGMLHAAGAPGFGFSSDNFIGHLPQTNAARATWAEFYRSERLEPMIRRATDEGLGTTRLRTAFERLSARLESLVGPEEPPARLHGDLWGGNLHVDEEGAPCLVNPAVYGGHREIDLAMMRLFGGFSERTFSAYEEATPLSQGHEDRVPLYQLYPLLVHVNLFGGSYVGAAQRAIDRYA